MRKIEIKGLQPWQERLLAKYRRGNSPAIATAKRLGKLGVIFSRQNGKTALMTWAVEVEHVNARLRAAVPDVAERERINVAVGERYTTTINVTLSECLDIELRHHRKNKESS